GLIAAASLSFVAWKLLRLRGQEALPSKRILLLGTSLFLLVPLLLLLLQHSVSSRHLEFLYRWMPGIKPLLEVVAIVAVGAGRLHLYYTGGAMNQARMRWGGLLAGLLCAFLLGLLDAEQERIHLTLVFASMEIVWLLGRIAFYPLIVYRKRWRAF